MSVPRMIITADWSTRRMSRGVRTRASRGRGGWERRAGSTGSTPRDCAGGPSIIISAMRRWSVMMIMMMLKKVEMETH